MHPRPVVAVAAYTTQKERAAPLFSGIDLQDKGLVAILYGAFKYRAVYREAPFKNSASARTAFPLWEIAFFWCRVISASVRALPSGIKIGS